MTAAPRPRALVLALASLLPFPYPGQEDGSLPPGAEGPLANDCFVPTETGAERQLAEGDRALARARAAENASERARWFATAFDHWTGALAASAGDGGVAWTSAAAGADDVPRVFEGAARAVLRRVGTLDPEARRAWHARVDGLAAERLARAGYSPGLSSPDGKGAARAWAEIERLHPGTRSAARAALLLSDLALEAGRGVAARGWSGRGLEHAALAGADELGAALERRRARAASADAAPDEAWESAGALTFVGMLAPTLGPDDHRRGVRTEDVPPQSGLAFLGPDRVGLQTGEEVQLVHLASDGPERLARFRPSDLLDESLGWITPSWNRDGKSLWRHRPAAVPGTADELVLVHGRSDPSGAGEAPNALLRVALPNPAGSRLGGVLTPTQRIPRVAWAVSGDLRLDSRGRAVSDPELAELAGAEMQPGPLVVGDLVLVQARVYEGEVRAWLLAFDLADGTLRWKRFLAKGADVIPERGRFGGRGPSLSSEHLVRADGRIFAGTHLGAGFLVDAWDGRLVWGLKNRRRDPADPGWQASPPTVVSGGREPEILWTPGDSDRLYRLRGRPLEAGAPVPEGLWTHSPRPIGEAEVLVGGDPHAAVVLGRAGPEWTVSSLGETGSGRRDALYLAPGERFRGRGLVSATRVLACTDRGAYLFDRSRDLYLLDYEPLPPPGGALSEARGGELFARGSWVVALAGDALWALRAD